MDINVQSKWIIVILSIMTKCEIIMETFSNGSTCFNIYIYQDNVIMMVIFEICDETQRHHKNDRICTKKIGIGAVITTNYQYYGTMILTCIIYIFSICMVYFNFVVKSLGDVINHKHQTEMKRVQIKQISGNESYNVNDNVIVMVQVYVKKNFNLNYDFNLHFLRKLLLLLSIYHC